MQNLPAAMNCLPTPADEADESRTDVESMHLSPRLPLTSKIGRVAEEHEQFLADAFRSFTDAATSLERVYESLSGEVQQLRGQLATANSELSRSLEKNRSTLAYLDQILESLPCGVLVVSADGRISRKNPEAARLLRTDASSSHVWELAEPLQQLLLSARKQDCEPQRPVPTGSDRRWLAVRHAFTTDGASVFILRDTTQQKKLEEAEQRFRSKQALAELAALLAHEIRNPLGSMELFAGLLAESDLSAECSGWVEHLQSGLRTLAATVNNVLHFHSTPELQCAPVNVLELLRWARDFLMPVARESGVMLTLQNREPDAILFADRHRLEQVLLNLILNGIRATPAGGWVEVSWRQADQGKALELTVADTGRGIPDEVAPRIFEAGFSTRVGSPGLGLTLCRNIVEQHRGTIRAVSRADGGATFTITLPARRNSAEDR